MIFFTAHTDGGGLMVPFYGVPRIPAPRITTLAILSHLTRTTIGTVTCWISVTHWFRQTQNYRKQTALSAARWTL